MPPRLHRPTAMPEDHERLIDMLWRFYIAAHEPPVRKIARAIEELDDDQRRGTANHETIRRTLRALALPQWETVEVIFLALCQIADVDPDDIDNGYRQSHRDELHSCYRFARYGEVTDLPRTREEKARQEAETEAKRRRREAQREPQADPWGSAPSAGSFGGGLRADEEPPF